MWFVLPIFVEKCKAVFIFKRDVQIFKIILDGIVECLIRGRFSCVFGYSNLLNNLQTDDSPTPILQ